LKDLGWGIEIMDNVTYELINSLVQYKMANILIIDDQEWAGYRTMRDLNGVLAGIKTFKWLSH